MKNALAFVLLWAGLILESTLFEIPPVKLVHPDLVLVCLVVISLTRGARAALMMGVLIGLLQDASFGAFLGLNAFTYGVLGYFAAAAFAQFLQRNLALTFLVTIVCTFVEEWLTFGLTRMFNVTGYAWRTVLAHSLWQMIVNGIVLLLLYSPLVRWLSERPRGRYQPQRED
ncbi:MAG: rod shape-determining protein MreD [Alicyclobacillaceae bacterium]|nr:rod shape-determining protein MreD [Alicyclobacillaceae bacterium]